VENERKRERKTTQAAQKLLALNKGKRATWEEKPLHQKRRKQSVRIKRVVGRQASRPLLISLLRRMLKRTSGLDKLMSIVNRMSMELKSKFLDSLRIKAETLPRKQSVRNVNNNPYTKENDMKNMVSCTQKGASDTAGELRNDCDQWYVV